MKIIKKSIVFLVVVVLVIGLLPIDAFAVKPARKIYVITNVETYTYDDCCDSESTGVTTIPAIFSFAAKAFVVVQSVLAATSSLT